MVFSVLSLLGVGGKQFLSIVPCGKKLLGAFKNESASLVISEQVICRKEARCQKVGTEP